MFLSNNLKLSVKSRTLFLCDSLLIRRSLEKQQREREEEEKEKRKLEEERRRRELLRSELMLSREKSIFTPIRFLL
jgi:hypothetical protein